MTWHYQIMRHSDQQYAVHEYYPTEDGGGWTEEPIKIEGDSVEDIREQLKMILNDIDNHGVKDYE